MPKQDAGYKLLFSHATLVRDFLLAFFPLEMNMSGQEKLCAVQKISGSWIDENDLQRRDNDIVWLCEMKLGNLNVPFFLLIEFQTQPDPIMPIRLATYSSLLYEELYRSKKVKSGAFPRIFPVVLYNGTQSWTAPKRIEETQISDPDILSRWQLFQEMFLIDQLNTPEHLLPESSNFMGLLIRIERSRKPAEALDWINQMIVRLNEFKEFKFKQSVTAWLKKSFLPTRMPKLDLSELHTLEEIVMSIENNTLDWSVQYLEQGRAEGLHQGHQNGLAEGLTKMKSMMQKLLSRKFGPLPDRLRAKVESADLGALENLADVIMDLESLEDIERILNNAS